MTASVWEWAHSPVHDVPGRRIETEAARTSRASNIAVVSSSGMVTAPKHLALEVSGVKLAVPDPLGTSVRSLAQPWNRQAERDEVCSEFQICTQLGLVQC